MSKESASLSPSNFSNKQAFVRAVLKQSRAEAELLWKKERVRSKPQLGRPSEQSRTEDVIIETINEHFYAVRDILRMPSKTTEKRKALKELGNLSQGKLTKTVRVKMEARNPKDGDVAPHEDTIQKYVKGDRIFNRTDPDKLTVAEAKWLAKHQPMRAKSILQLHRIWKASMIPEEILEALSTAEVRTLKK